MQIIGVYNNITENFVKAVVTELQSLGFQADAISIDSYTYTYEISSFPSFLLLKENKAGYALIGKHSIETIIDWAKRSGATCN
jgi:hypothetical protein